MANHTPAPWEMSETKRRISIFGELHTVAEIDYPDSEDKANAILICVAPKLLEALEHAADALEKIAHIAAGSGLSKSKSAQILDAMPYGYGEARAAIAKAKGL